MSVDPVPPIERADVPSYPGLRGQVAVVTGGANGIGEATCMALGANGVRTVLADRDEAAARRVGEALEAWGEEALAVACDVTSEDDLRRVDEAARERWGTAPSLLFPFAGGFESYTPVQEIEPEEWRALLELNLTGSFLAMRTFLPAMIEAGRGAIVLMGSSAARNLDAVATAPYAAAKSGTVQLMRHAALELGAHGIRVNSICPATVRSPRVDRIIPPERQAEIAARTPLRRLGNPIDAACAALFLASDSAGWITGVALDVAGGRVMV